MDLKINVKGVQEFQVANLRYIRALEPTGVLDEATRDGIVALQRFQAGITHVDTGALRGSRRVRFTRNSAELFTSSTASNPRTGTPVLQYDDPEEMRGGGHANWQNTFEQAGPRIAQGMIVKLVRALS